MTRDGSNNDDVAAELDELSLKYAGRLGEKMRELTAAVERARAGSSEALAEAFKLAHTLHGTAGSYGFRPVSMAARGLEALLRPARDGVGTADWNAVEAALRALAHEVATVTARL
jgi:HPt (histidine-containing phosphotransfer) domain-containing protein